MRPNAVLLPAVALAMLAAGVPARAQQAEPAPPAYRFASPPSAQANRLYSVNVTTGEVSACQFERPENNLVGVTRCFPRDPSAGPQKEGHYEVLSTHYSGETGVFRVNRDTGEMSICYVRDMPKAGPDGATGPAVVCTPPTK